MKLISMITGEDDAFGCDYAFIDLTRDLAGLVLRRIAMLREQKCIDKDLFEMYFWDYHTEYFSPWLAERSDETDRFATMMEGLPAVADDLMMAPIDFSVLESLLARVECCQMIVREDAIAFVAIPKHTSSYIYTADIPLPVIEAVATA